GITSTSQDPATNYGASLVQDSVYTIQLIAYSEHGCPDTATNTVRVYPKPTASFSQSDTAGCGPLTVSFTNSSVPYDTSTIADMTFSWDFGNGQTSTLQSPSVTYTAAAINDTVYTIRLIAYSEHGCADTMQSQVRIHPKPSVSLTKDDSTGCDPVTVNFTASGVNVATYHWRFTSSDSSTTQNPTFDFRAIPFDDTTYIVTLVGESPYGCVSDTAKTNVAVLGGPSASFYPSPDSVCATTSSQMINNSLGATSYYWDFGNGDTSSAVSPQALFTLNPAADTAYHVLMVASSGNGCRDTADAYVVVSPIPTAAFTMDYDTGCSPHTVNFTSQSIFAASHHWYYSNGYADTGSSPSFAFTNSGVIDSIYTVRLIVTNLGGCNDTATDEVRVYPFPSADFVISPSSGCGDLTASFSNQSTPNDTGSISIMSFEWDLGNGSSSTQINPSSTYSKSLVQDSVYTVQLIAFSEHGCRDTIEKNLRVFPKPRASFTQSDTAGCGPLTVSFYNTSIPYDTGSIADMHFQWNFGNGYVGYDPNDTITFYPANGVDTVYTIRLIAFSEHGCRDTMYSTVRVYPDPASSFTRSPASGCGPLSVQFSSSGTNVQTFHWDFGNGDTSSQSNPGEDFTNVLDIDTVYTVSMWSESPYGCLSDTSTKTVTVRPNPVAAFSKDGDSLCGTSQVIFANGSTGATSYAWSFGDGSTASNANPQHNFSASQTVDTSYRVRLIATNYFGCLDTAYDTVHIFPLPTAVITSNPSAGCTPLSVSFGQNSLLSVSSFWDFGNGTTDTAHSPSSNFINATLNDTLYDVKLRVESVHGCLDSSIESIRVYPLPTTDFVAQPNNGCGDLSVQFSNQSTPNDTGDISVMTFEWALGNGINTTATNPSTTYSRSLTQDSIYTVRLIGASEHGCLDTAYKTVRTYPKPLSLFTQSDTDGCSPLNVSFTNQSTPYDTGSINDMTFRWDFGNGQTSTAVNPTPVFYASTTQDSVYTIRLIAYSEHGCADTNYSTVRVHPNPLVAFTPNTQTGCGPLSVQFTGNTLNTGTHYWDFGDGDTSSQANPSHVFASQPNIDTSYTVQYWSSSPYGCWSDTVSTTIIVRPTPVANFSQNFDSLCGGGTIQYSNNSTLGYSYSWTFGDGSASTSTVNPQHTFSEIPFTDTGYSVTLIATSVYGCKDTLTKPTTIFPLPDAQITFSPDSGCSPLLVQFGNTSIIAASHNWNFGDNTTSTGDTLSHLFVNQLGIYRDFQIIQEAVSIHGCLDHDTVTVRVHPLPRPNFAVNKTGICDTSSYIFRNYTAGAVGYQWFFGDGTGSYQDGPTHIYPTAVSSDTSFTAKLIATSNRGCVDSLSQSITVTPIMLAKASTINASGCNPLTVDFVNNSTNASNYYWDFGDGFVNTGQSPSHTYINPDYFAKDYTVTLIVSNALGCADTTSVTVSLQPNITANFTIGKTSSCTQAAYDINNLSQGSTIYNWDFGDGTSSTDPNPSHVFPTSLSQDTVFTVRLVASSAYGCYDTAYRTVTVHPILTAAFVVDAQEACGFMLAHFTNQSTNAIYFDWDFGDGTGSALKDPSHPYGQVGVYQPSIIVYDAYGCSATYSLPNPVIIWEIPKANFIATPSSQRLPNSTVDFTDLSVANDPLNYHWNFGEPSSGSNTSTLSDPQHIYADSGTYLITQIIDNGHCSDTATRSVTIEYYYPIASFYEDPDTGCMDLTVTFTNESQYADSYHWYFGDGGQSTDENPTHTYTTPGSYTVTLLASGPGGVDDSTKTDIILVIQKPYAKFYTTPTVAWLPNTSIQFVNTSILANAYLWQIDGPNGDDFTSNDDSPIITLNEEGEYTVMLIAMNTYGCTDTAYKENYIRINAGGVLLVPNAFTPNGDGVNDNFRPVFEGVERDHYTFKVYNRWGELLFETHDIDEAWDGTFRGVMCESTVYVWQVEGNYYGAQHFQQRGKVMLMK
ncbi:MAG: PKD domain-containing protein, partial [Bacteroidetes bacterium]|nr:PKD domain-containing protein [Bacteroidota bacterium]